jgi:hypothetical protein
LKIESNLSTGHLSFLCAVPSFWSRLPTADLDLFSPFFLCNDFIKTKQWWQNFYSWEILLLLLLLVIVIPWANSSMYIRVTFCMLDCWYITYLFNIYYSQAKIEMMIYCVCDTSQEWTSDVWTINCVRLSNKKSSNERCSNCKEKKKTCASILNIELFTHSYIILRSLIHSFTFTQTD